MSKGLSTKEKGDGLKATVKGVKRSFEKKMYGQVTEKRSKSKEKSSSRNQEQLVTRTQRFMRRVLTKEGGNLNIVDIDDQYFEKEIKTPQAARKNKNDLV